MLTSKRVLLSSFFSQFSLLLRYLNSRKKEEGRRKKEEGRRKREEGRRGEHLLNVNWQWERRAPY